MRIVVGIQLRIKQGLEVRVEGAFDVKVILVNGHGLNKALEHIAGIFRIAINGDGSSFGKVKLDLGAGDARRSCGELLEHLDLLFIRGNLIGHALEDSRRENATRHILDQCIDLLLQICDLLLVCGRSF